MTWSNTWAKYVTAESSFYTRSAVITTSVGPMCRINPQQNSTIMKASLACESNLWNMHSMVTFDTGRPYRLTIKYNLYCDVTLRSGHASLELRSRLGSISKATRRWSRDRTPCWRTLWHTLGLYLWESRQDRGCSPTSEVCSAAVAVLSIMLCWLLDTPHTTRSQYGRWRTGTVYIFFIERHMYHSCHTPYTLAHDVRSSSMFWAWSMSLPQQWLPPVYLTQNVPF